MKKARNLIGFFESSTQGMGKLLDFQKTTDIRMYKEQENPKKPLQDVETRWWSTYRSIRCLRFLKKAIKSLIAAEEITCHDLSDDEWKVLHQIEITLETMAEFQRILEGESYVTGSLVPVAVYQIWQSYSEVIESDYAEPSVVNLAGILLEDFDKRYTPADFQCGTLKYYREDVTGSCNRYVGIHQYFFIAAFLDPRVAPMLPEMMTNADFEQLNSVIVDLMSTKAKASKQNKTDISPTGTTHAQGSEVAS